MLEYGLTYEQSLEIDTVEAAQIVELMQQREYARQAPNVDLLSAVYSWIGAKFEQQDLVDKYLSGHLRGKPRSKYKEEDKIYSKQVIKDIEHAYKLKVINSEYMAMLGWEQLKASGVSWEG